MDSFLERLQQSTINDSVSSTLLSSALELTNYSSSSVFPLPSSTTSSSSLPPSTTSPSLPRKKKTVNRRRRGKRLRSTVAPSTTTPPTTRSSPSSRRQRTHHRRRRPHPRFTSTRTDSPELFTTSSAPLVVEMNEDDTRLTLPTASALLQTADFTTSKR